MGPYIPSQDGLLNTWAQNFAALITAAPSTYFLAPGDAASIQAADDAYAAAYTLAIEPATRTKPSVAAKDNARSAMLLTLRSYAILIRNNQGVSDENKLALGLTVPDLTPTPIPAPDTSPILTVVAATPGEFTIRYADSATPDKKAKPFGAIGLEIFAAAPASGVPTFDTSTYMGTFTKQPLGLDVSRFTAGRLCYLWARWVTRGAPKGSQQSPTGPESTPVTFIVP
jgi:hypothetical protein